MDTAAGEVVAVVAVGDADRPAVGACPRTVAGQRVWQGSTVKHSTVARKQQPDSSSLRSSDEAGTRYLSRIRMKVVTGKAIGQCQQNSIAEDDASATGAAPAG